MPLLSPTAYAPAYLRPFGAIPAPGSPGAAAGVTRNRYDIALAAAEQLLADTGAFDKVVLVFRPQDAFAGNELESELLSYAVLWPEGWREEDIADDSGGVPGVRRVDAFGLAIGVREEEPRERLARIARLESVAIGALSGSDLGGNAFPGWTRLARGIPDDASEAPEARTTIVGEFAQVVEGYSGRDALDDEM